MNHVVELTAEEKAEARQNAIRQYQDEELRKLQNRNKPTAKKKKPKLNHHYLTSDYETENTHTAGSRTFEQATTGIDRRTKGIRFPPLLQALRHQKGRRHEHLHRVRTFVEKRPRPCRYHLRMHLPPRCGMELETLRTRKSVFSDMEYFSIVTTCKQYQVIRFFSVKSRYKAGQTAEYSIFEVVQRWIAPDGKTTTVARLRGMSLFYYDLWNEYSDMEVRKNGEFRAYDINPVCTCPRQRFIPEVKRNGFKGDYHNILPYDLFKSHTFRLPSRNAVEGRAISHVALLYIPLFQYRRVLGILEDMYPKWLHHCQRLYVA